MESEIVVTIRHARKLKYCSSGIRNFCKVYGINYLKFVKEGIPSAKLKKIGDPLGLKLIEVAEECHRLNQR